MLSTLLLVVAAGLLAVEPPATAQALMFERGRVFVPVWVNGVGPYPFLLDTAAPYVALDAPIAEALELPEAGEPEQLGGFSARPVRVLVLDVAGSPTIDCEAYAADLSPMEALYGFRVAGILGLPGLPKRFRLDCSAREISAFPSEMGPEWLEIPFTTDPDGIMRVTVTLEGHYVREAVLDTAFAGTLSITEALLEKWGLLSEDTPRLRAMERGDAPADAQIRLGECAIGPVKVRNPLCALSDTGAVRIGMRLLSRFELALDRNAEMLYVRPLVALPWRDPPLYGTGVTPVERVHGFWSLVVAEDSPARMAGLVSGDLLVSVDGSDMAQQPFDAVQRALAGSPGEFLDIGVLRQGAVAVYRVAVEEML